MRLSLPPISLLWKRGAFLITKAVTSLPAKVPLSTTPHTPSHLSLCPADEGHFLKNGQSQITKAVASLPAKVRRVWGQFSL